MARSLGQVNAAHAAELEKVCTRCEEQTARADRLQALLDDAEARVSKLAGQLAAKPPMPEPNDSLTLTYWRAFYDQMSKDERQALPGAVRDMALPWHKRSPAWCHVVRTVQAAGRHGTPPGKLDSAPVGGGEAAQGVG